MNCSICDTKETVQVHTTYWLCGPCVLERIESGNKQLKQAHTALREINSYNTIKNDLEAYLSEVAFWGLGEVNEKPDPTDFGCVVTEL